MIQVHLCELPPWTTSGEWDTVWGWASYQPHSPETHFWFLKLDFLFGDRVRPVRHSLNDLLCYFSKIFLSNCCHICKYVTYINDKCITDHLLLSRPKIGTENMNIYDFKIFKWSLYFILLSGSLIVSFPSMMTSSSDEWYWLQAKVLSESSAKM